MTSNVIADAKYQELNISFTFNEQLEDKLLIKALSNNNAYEIEILPSPHFDFEQVKSVLLSKHFKVVSMSPQILKLKIGLAAFEFKNNEKITLNTFKQTIAQLTDKLKEQSQKNTILENAIRQLRKDLDLMTTNLADLRRQNDEIKRQKYKFQQEQFQIKKLRNEFIETIESLKAKNLEKEQIQKVKQFQEQRMKKQYEDKIAKLEQGVIDLRKELQNKIEQERARNKQEEERVRKLYEKELSKIVEDKQEKTEQRLLEMERKIFQLEEKNCKTEQKLVQPTQSQKNNTKIQLEKFNIIQQDRLGEIQQEENIKPQKQHRNELKQQTREPLKSAEKIQQERKIKQEYEKMQERLYKLEINQNNRRIKQLNQKQQQEKKQSINRILQGQVKIKIESGKIQQKPSQQEVKTLNSQYKFSQSHKHPQITLQNDNTKASGNWLALVDGKVFDKGSSIRFKILYHTGDVAIGLGIKKILLANGYQVLNGHYQIGHGCFFLFYDGEMWSHSNKEINGFKGYFSYQEGDVVKVATNRDQLLWINESSRDEFKMKIKLTEEEWKQACFCIYLSSKRLTSQYQPFIVELPTASVSILKPIKNKKKKR